MEKKSTCPTRRRWRSNPRYGFVKFTNVMVAKIAIERINGVCYLDKRISVSRVHFESTNKGEQSGRRNNKERSREGASLLGERQRNPVTHPHYPLAHIKQGVMHVEAIETDIEWIKSCAVGIIKDMGMVNGVGEIIRRGGFSCIRTRPLGGAKILPKFNTLEIYDDRKRLEAWFDVILE
ncbi:hypothetical protein U1Q18_030409 [Sarracenia purpurea var. burkii]